MKMTIEEMHRELCECLGWKVDVVHEQWAHAILDPNGKEVFFWNLAGRTPEEALKSAIRQALPPLTLDLIREIEVKLDGHLYWNELRRVVIKAMQEKSPILHNFCPSEIDICIACALATKEQRLEALLRTVGRWRE